MDTKKMNKSRVVRPVATALALGIGVAGVPALGDVAGIDGVGTAVASAQTAKTGIKVSDVTFGGFTNKDGVSINNTLFTDAGTKSREATSVNGYEVLEPGAGNRATFNINLTNAKPGEKVGFALYNTYVRPSTSETISQSAAAGLSVDGSATNVPLEVKTNEGSLLIGQYNYTQRGGIVVTLNDNVAGLTNITAPISVPYAVQAHNSASPTGVRQNRYVSTNKIELGVQVQPVGGSFSNFTYTNTALSAGFTEILQANLSDTLRTGIRASIRADQGVVDVTAIDLYTPVGVNLHGTLKPNFTTTFGDYTPGTWTVLDPSSIGGYIHVVDPATGADIAPKLTLDEARAQGLTFNASRNGQQIDFTITGVKDNWRPIITLSKVGQGSYDGAHSYAADIVNVSKISGRTYDTKAVTTFATIADTPAFNPEGGTFIRTFTSQNSIQGLPLSAGVSEPAPIAGQTRKFDFRITNTGTAWLTSPIVKLPNNKDVVLSTVAIGPGKTGTATVEYAVPAGATQLDFSLGFQGLSATSEARYIVGEPVSPPTGASSEEIAALQEKLAAAESEINKLKTDLAKTKTAADKAQADVNAANAELERVKNDLNATKKQVAAAQKAADDAQAAADKAQAAADKAQADVNAANAEITKLKADIAKHTQQIGDLQKDLDTAEAALEQAKKDITDLKAKDADLQKQLDAAKADRDATKARVTTLENELKKTNDEVDAAKKRVADLEKRADATDAEIAAAKKRLADLEKHAKDTDAELKKHLDLLNDHEKRITDLERRADETDRALEQAESERDNLQAQIDLIKNSISEVKDELSKVYGATIQDMYLNEDGQTVIRFRDGSERIIPGAETRLPYIGENGNWWIGNKDTGQPANKDAGTPEVGTNGNWIIGGKDTGKPATLPLTIGENGNWFIAGEDTGISAAGANQNGKTPYVGENGNWFIDGKDTGKSAKDVQLTVGSNGNWFLGTEDTGIKASVAGESGAPYIGENGNWFINGKDTGVSATGGAGKDGSDGSGTDGKDGNAGRDGSGKDGNSGRDGNSGSDGRDGSGRDGSNGAAGADGTAGVNGANGYVGKDGQTPDISELISGYNEMYEIWKSQPGNENKTIEEFHHWINNDATTTDIFELWKQIPGNENKTIDDFYGEQTANLPGITSDMFYVWSKLPGNENKSFADFLNWYASATELDLFELFKQVPGNENKAFDAFMAETGVTESRLWNAYQEYLAANPNGTWDEFIALAKAGQLGADVADAAAGGSEQGNIVSRALANTGASVTALGIGAGVLLLAGAAFFAAARRRTQ